MEVCNRQRRLRVNPRSIERLCRQVLDALEEGPGALTVVLAGGRTMRALNRQFRGRDYPTDVLSFAYEEPACDGVRELGEIVISPVIAARQAVRWGASAEAEMRLLIVHGILHLLGYDHETDQGEMIRLQRRLLRRRTIAHCGPILLGAPQR
ncbi:MAG: rRNA maturation RNase YbeY [Acidobacteria bacterium]|nr:rRNA maturation RNase YbeY [Acidobacteriota bacterium]